MASFANQLNQFNVKTQSKVNTVVQRVGLRLLGKLVMRSPVDTGRFRGNWQLQLNDIPSGIVETVDRDGGPTITTGESELAGAAIGDAIYITNNLPYAQVLENGHSQQAPTGMLAITVAEFNGIVEDVAQGL